MKYIFIILLFLTEQTFSCECHERNNFFDNSLKSTLIVLAKVDSFTSYYLNSMSIPIVMEVTIIETLKGRSSNTKIFIRGQEGKNCLEMLNKFRIGEKYVFALYPSFFDKSLTPVSTTFDLSSCGEHWIPYTNDHVNGVISTDLIVYNKKLDTIQSKIDGYHGSDDKPLEKLYKERQKLYKTHMQHMTYKSFKQKLSFWKQNNS